MIRRGDDFQDGCSLSHCTDKRPANSLIHPSIAKMSPEPQAPSPHSPFSSCHRPKPGVQSQATGQLGQTRTETGGRREGDLTLARVAPGVGCITDGPTCFSLTTDCQRAARMEPGQLKRASRWRGPNLQKRDPTELSMEPLPPHAAEGIHDRWARTWVLFLFGFWRVPSSSRTPAQRRKLSSDEAVAHSPIGQPCACASPPPPPFRSLAAGTRSVRLLPGSIRPQVRRVSSTAL